VLLLAYAACCGRSTVEAEPAVSAAPMKRLSLEMDGSSAQHRRERVPLSAEEQQGEGDVDREIKVGAVFEGEAGPECSELVPGVFVDRAGPIRDVARRATAEAFGPFLSALAERCGFPVPSRSWSSGTALQGSGSGLVKRTLFAPRPLAGAPPSFALRECTWAVASPRPPAKRLLPRVPNGQACGFLPLVWTLSWSFAHCGFDSRV